eukprot:6157886-Amphidinium_carterae.1
MSVFDSFKHEACIVRVRLLERERQLELKDLWCRSNQNEPISFFYLPCAPSPKMQCKVMSLVPCMDSDNSEWPRHDATPSFLGMWQAASFDTT